MDLKKIVSVLVFIIVFILLSMTVAFAAGNDASRAVPYILQAEELGLLTENAVQG